MAKMNRLPPEMNHLQPEMNFLWPEFNRLQPEFNSLWPEMNHLQPEIKSLMFTTGNEPFTAKMNRLPLEINCLQPKLTVYRRK